MRQGFIERRLKLRWRRVDEMAVPLEISTIPEIVPNRLLPRPPQQHIQVGFQLYFVGYIPPVAAIEAARLGIAGFEPLKKLVGKDDVDICRDDEFSECPPDSDILGDHLEHRQAARVAKLAVQSAPH